MGLEDNVRLIVEQMLAAMVKENHLSISQGEQASVKASPLRYVNPSEYLDEWAEEDEQDHLQVPEPIDLRRYEAMKRSTPARIGVWRCGPRPLTDTLLRFRADHAVAQDSVLGEVPPAFPAMYNMVYTRSMCQAKDEYLTRPDLGRRLDAESMNKIRTECQRGTDVQIIVSDGLSSKAVEANIPNLLPAMLQGLEGLEIKVGRPIFVKGGRVAVMDTIGEVLNPQAAIVLIGERPGLGTAESMSAYIGYRPRAGMVESERTVISNIHKGGTPAVEAGAHLATLLKKILDAKASGVNLE